MPPWVCYRVYIPYQHASLGVVQVYIPYQHASLGVLTVVYTSSMPPWVGYSLFNVATRRRVGSLLPVINVGMMRRVGSLFPVIPWLMG